MTTVVYRDGIMVSDSQVTANYSIAGQAKKVFKIKGYLIGVSGTMKSCQDFVEWFKDNGLDHGFQSDHDFGGLIVDPKGVVYHYEKSTKGFVKTKNKYDSIGSGALYAKTALLLGNNAVASLKTAIKMDLFSGGPIQKITLKGR
jgi:20S proteasome alpha/beta subunit